MKEIFTSDAMQLVIDYYKLCYTLVILYWQSYGPVLGTFPRVRKQRVSWQEKKEERNEFWIIFFLKLKGEGSDRTTDMPCHLNILLFEPARSRSSAVSLCGISGFQQLSINIRIRINIRVFFRLSLSI
jgi:hypothetical protein